MLSADQSLSNGNHACDIIDLARRRGFDRITRGINCQLATTNENPTPYETPSAPNTQREQTKQPLPQCGVLGIEASQKTATWPINFLSLLFLSGVIYLYRKKKELSKIAH